LYNQRKIFKALFCLVVFLSIAGCDGSKSAKVVFSKLPGQERISTQECKSPLALSLNYTRAGNDFLLGSCTDLVFGENIFASKNPVTCIGEIKTSESTILFSSLHHDCNGSIDLTQNGQVDLKCSGSIFDRFEGELLLNHASEQGEGESPITLVGNFCQRAVQSVGSVRMAAAPTTCPVPANPDVYTASVDFSTIQGCRQWTYRTSAGANMTFDTAANLWQGPETYLRIYSNGAHPGNVADAVRRWTAPKGGSVRITGRVSDAHSTCGDGVNISIKKGATVLWTNTLANGNTTGLTYDVTTTVALSETIDFIVNRKTEWGCDSTTFDPTVAYTTTTPPPPPPPLCPVPANPDVYTASLDFSGTQGCRQWTYRTSAGVNMTYDSTNRRWFGPETYLWLYNNGAHPGNVADAVRRWTAPKAGSVRITGRVSDASSTCGDGVNISIKKGATVLWTNTLANGNTTGLTYDVTTTVALSETIDFVVNRKTEWGCDSTNFDPTVAYTTTTPGTVSATLSWSPNQEADLAGYIIYYSDVNGSWSKFAPITVMAPATSKVISNLTAGKIYYFAVTAFDTSNNESLKSVVVSIQK